MPVPFVNKDISILTQVCFKAFVETEKRLPKSQDDWDEINICTADLFLNSKKNSDRIEGPVMPTRPLKSIKMDPEPPIDLKNQPIW